MPRKSRNQPMIKYHDTIPLEHMRAISSMFPGIVLIEHMDDIPRLYVQGLTNPEIAEIFSRGMTEFDELSEQEQRRFYWIMNEWVFQLQHVWQLYEKGLASEVDFDAWLYTVATMIKTGGGAIAWNNMQATITPTVRKVINEYLAQHPDTPAFIDLIPMLKYGYKND